MVNLQIKSWKSLTSFEFFEYLHLRVRLTALKCAGETESVTSQPWLHTLMQPRLSANQSVRTILVIL